MNNIDRYTTELQYKRVEFNDQFINFIYRSIESKVNEYGDKEWINEIKEVYMKFDVIKHTQKCFALFLFKPEIVIQEWTAILKPALTCSTAHRTGMAINFYIQTLLESGLFKCNRTLNDQWFIKLLYPLNIDISKVGYLVPSYKPLKAVTKYNIGYEEFNERILCGSKLNPLEGDLCLSHINRVNSVAFRYDPRVSELIGFRFDERDKVRGDHIETAEEKEERRKSFNLLKDAITTRSELFKDRPFWLAHKFDKRGRTYCKAYECNYQGIKPVKASIVFNLGEIIKEEE